MNRKLTLSVDDFVVEKAKKYAAANRKSLSKLVENYFRLLTSDQGKGTDELSPLVKELLGSFDVPADFDYEKEKLEYLKNRYLND